MGVEQAVAVAQVIDAVGDGGGGDNALGGPFLRGEPPALAPLRRGRRHEGDLPDPELEPGSLNPVEAGHTFDAGVDGVEGAAGGEINQPIGGHRRPGCGARGDVAEPAAAPVGVDEVQAACVVSDVEAAVAQGRGGFDIAADFVFPELFAGLGVQGVDDVAGRGYVGDAVMDEGRRRNGQVGFELPEGFAGFPAQREHFVIGQPGIHQAVAGDGQGVIYRAGGGYGPQFRSGCRVQGH